MLVLFDNGTPRTLARYLIDHHTVTEARSRGWEELGNGELLSAAESAGFEVLVTTDKNLRYQQNLEGRTIAVVVLGLGRWSLIKAHIVQVSQTVNEACAVSFPMWKSLTSGESGTGRAAGKSGECPLVWRERWLHLAVEVDSMTQPSCVLYIAPSL